MKRSRSPTLPPTAPPPSRAKSFRVPFGDKKQPLPPGEEDEDSTSPESSPIKYASIVKPPLLLVRKLPFKPQGEQGEASTSAPKSPIKYSSSDAPSRSILKKPLKPPGAEGEASKSAANSPSKFASAISGPSRSLSSPPREPDAKLSPVPSDASTLKIVNETELSELAEHQMFLARKREMFFRLRLRDRLRQAAHDPNGVERGKWDNFQKMGLDTAIDSLRSIAYKARHMVLRKYPGMGEAEREPDPEDANQRWERMYEAAGDEGPSLADEPPQMQVLRNNLRLAVWDPTSIMWDDPMKYTIHLAVETVVFTVAIINRAHTVDYE